MSDSIPDLIARVKILDGVLNWDEIHTIVTALESLSAPPAEVEWETEFRALTPSEGIDIPSDWYPPRFYSPDVHAMERIEWRKRTKAIPAGPWVPVEKGDASDRR